MVHESVKPSHVPRSEIFVEPTTICRVGCRQCTFRKPGSRPIREVTLPPKTLRQAITALKELGIAHEDYPVFVHFSVAGDPFKAPLHNQSKVILEELPRAQLIAFTTLDFDTQQEVLTKSEGLHSIIASLDSHHYAHFHRMQLAKGLRGEKAKTAALQYLSQRLKWAAQAASQRQIAFAIRTTGPEKERAYWKSFALEALDPNPPVFDPKPRDPAGYSVNRKKPGIYVLANGLITSVVPQDREPLD